MQEKESRSSLEEMELEKESLEMVMDSRRLMVELDAVDTTRVAFAGPEKAEVRAAAASAVEQFYSSVHRLEDQGEKDALVEEEFPFRKAEQFLFMARKQLDGLATAIGMATRANQLAFNRARAAGGREGELVDRLDDTLMARENRIAADRCGVLLQEKKRQLGEVKEILKRGRDRIQQAKRFSKRYVQDLDDLGNFWKVSVAPSANQWDRTIVVDCGLGDKDNVNKGGKAEGRVFLCPNDGFRVKEQDKGFVKLNLFQMYEWFGEPLDPTAQDPVGSVPVSNALHSFQSALLFKRVFSRIASDQVPLPEVVKVFNNSIVLENPGSEPIEILFEKVTCFEMFIFIFMR